MNQKHLSTQELLGGVQGCKEALAEAIICHSEEKMAEAERNANQFLCEHSFQILDIVDDALYNYINGRR